MNEATTTLTRAALEELKRENSGVWVLILMPFVLPVFVVVMLMISKDDHGYCNSIMLMNRYQSLGDCVRANPGRPLTVCNYDPSPLPGNYTGPIYKNPHCGQPRPKGEKRNRYDVPHTLPHLATSIEPLRKCGGGRSWYWCSAYTKLGEHYPESLTQ